MLLESFWAGGWLIAALISYFVIPKYGWEVAMILSAIPALYALYLRWNLPDSPRFQKVEKGQLLSKYKVSLVWRIP